jgi:subtilase family serine protease/prenyltransferase beta subunit
VFLVLIILQGTVFAQTSSIANGVNWIKSVQSPEGYWGDASEVSNNSFIDTSTIAETLKYLNETGPAYNSAVQWINAAEVSNNDYLLIKFLVLALAGYDVSAIRDYLLTVRNNDGGWGAMVEFESDIKRTSLATQALKVTNYSDQSVISSALGYLLSTQNSDGGWGFYPSTCSGCEADPSNVYMTATVLQTLSQYKTIYNLETAINNGVAYLLTKQNSDGGVGSSPSTVYETALAFLALIMNGQGQAQPLQNAINYLTSTQLSNGSWNDDPYSTALALRALAHVKPNLSVFPTDITFSNPNPRIGETIAVTATIYNEGPAIANNIVVQFYDGDPCAGGVLIGETTIPSITPFGSYQVSISWTIPTASSRKVFVKIDPLNSIDELDETDNTAFRNLTSSTLPDLTLGSTDIQFNPETPRVGEPMTISITVRNQGESQAENFMVYVYAGDPDQDGIKIAEATYNYLPGGGSDSFRIGWAIVQGVDRITVKLDPLSQVPESNENNNLAYRLLNSVSPPLEGIDLVAIPKSLSFSPGLPQEGNPVTITAQVHNNGTLEASNIGIDFFDRDPSNNVQKIHSTVIPYLGSGQKQSISFQHLFTNGVHTIYMEIDPQNQISEGNETNNTLSANLTVIEGSVVDTLTIPKNLRGTSTKNSITIKWDAVTRFYSDGYYVYQEGIRQNTVPIKTETYTDLGLPSGTLYHYQVSSVDTYGNESLKSEILAISTIISDIDLKVDYRDVTISPEDARPGDTVTIRARIHNQGTDPVSNVPVSLYTLEAHINTIYVPSIGPGGEYLLATTWVVSDPSDFIYIQVDPGDVHLETDEFNNLAIVSLTRNVRFTEVSRGYGLSVRALGDLDNDGDLDIFAASSSWILVNDGMGNFTALTPDKTGLKSATDYSGAFGDIDNDGYLDLFICNTWAGDNRLYRNNGNLTFTDITQQAGLKSINTYTVNAVFGDLNNDGYLDLFVGAFGGEQYIYLNNGDRTFRKIPGFSEGYENVELGDIDGDGDLDVVVCAGNAVIYKNDGTGHFTRHQALLGSSSWDVALGDMDNDGYLDIVTLDGRVFYNDGHGNFSLSNSVLLPRGGVYTISLADFDNDGDLDILYSEYGYLIRNDGNLKFTDITPLNQLSMPWYTVLLGDIDNDGDIDIVGGQYIYKNQMNNNNYIIFSLRGIESNYYGMGSKIRVYEEGHLGEKSYLKGFRQVQAGGQGYVSQDSSDAHFGLNSDYLYDIQVEFPASGIVVNRRSTSTGRKLILPEYGDLYVNPQDITFSPEVPVDGDNLIVTAVIHNPTTIDVDNVVVGFYDGNPTAGGMELGRVELSYVPAEGEKAFPIQIVLSEEVHEIYVLIDPDNVLRETNKGNNIASRTVTVVPRLVDQDLSISASDVGISPVAPWEGAEVTISAIVHSSGTRDIQNVPVAFYDGDPVQGGILIGGTIIPTILASGDAQTQVQWNTLGRSGLHYVHVLVDPQNLAREVNESNNSALIALEVTAPAKPDLAITASDIIFSSLNPNEGESLTINATVRNLGTAASGIEVLLYNGDPSQGGIVLSQKTIPQIIPLGGTAVLNFAVNTVGLAGGHSFFIRIDPNNRIDEMIESNNIVSSSLAIGSSNLNLSLSTDKSVYTANENVQITVNIYNLINSNRSGTLEVKILDGNSNLVATVSSQALTLGPNETRTLTYIWNTGQTLSGGYKVACQFSEGGNIISRAEAPITIAPAKNISSRVAADKITYQANQVVTITSTITSLSPNYIFSNLNARIRITNGQATTLLTDSKTIPLLTPNQLSTLNTYWNTSTNPAGIYTVSLEVFEGLILLRTSTTSFEILRTQDTGEGLKGTITAQPNPVYRGQEDTLTYTITNIGNEDIDNLNIKVLIVNPDTQEIKLTFGSLTNIPMNTTKTDDFIFSTFSLTPQTYIAILQVSPTTITLPKTLAHTTFEVKPGIEVTKTIPDIKNIVVWVNEECRRDHSDHRDHSIDKDHSLHPQCHDDHEKKCIRLDLLEKILHEATDSYLIVHDREDIEKVKAPYYTDILILGDHHFLSDDYRDEWIELVFSGKGLISSLYLKKDGCHKENDEALFGVEYEGHLSDYEHQVHFPDSRISSEEMRLKARGKAIRVEVDDPDGIVAWIEDSEKHRGHHESEKHQCHHESEEHQRHDKPEEHQCHHKPEKHPGVVLNRYGLGNTVFFAFDLGLTLDDENYDQVSTILKNAVAYVHKPLDTKAFHPYQMVPIEIEIKSLGGSFDARIKETYLPEMKLFDPVTGKWVKDRPWVVDIHLGPDETKTVFFYALAPDKAGVYLLETEIGYLDNGVYNFYQSLSTEIVLQKDSAQMVSDIIEALKSLTVSKKDKEEREEAIENMEKVQRRDAVTAKDVERNIDDTLEAIESLLSITSADVSDIRLMMDILLEVWIGRWFFYK